MIGCESFELDMIVVGLERGAANGGGLQAESCGGAAVECLVLKKSAWG